MGLIGGRFDLGAQVNKQMSSGKGGPPPPDYTALAEQDAANSQKLATQNTWADRADQQNPWGSLTWGTEKTVDPATGQDVTKWTSKTTLDPQLQGALDDEFAIQGGRTDIAAGLMNQARGELTRAPDWSQFTPMQNAPQSGNLQALTPSSGMQTTSPYQQGGQQQRGGGAFGFGGGQQQMRGGYGQQGGQMGYSGGQTTSPWGGMGQQTTQAQGGMGGAITNPWGGQGQQTTQAQGGWQGGPTTGLDGGLAQQTTQAQGGYGQQTTQAQGGYGQQTTQADGSGLQATTQANGGGAGAFSFGVDTGRDQAPGLNTGLGGYAGQGLRSGLDFSGAQDVAGSGASRQRAEDAIYKSATSRLDPQFQQQQARMESDLANRGITRGSQAYQQEMETFGRTKNDAYQQALMGSVTGGGAEAQRNQGMDLGLRQQQVGEEAQAAGFQNAAQQQGFSQRFGSEQAQNDALSQQFGLGQQARGQQLSAQQLALQQQGQGFNQQLGQQQQAFGQNLNLDQAALQRQQQAYAQGQGLDQSQLQRQQQAYSQGQGLDQSALQRQQQAYGQMQGLDQSALQRQQQNFGQNVTLDNQGLARQQQAFGQGQSLDASSLARQQQAFGQGMNVDQQQLARQQQAYGQMQGLDASSLARQQQAFGQGQSLDQAGLARQQQAYSQNMGQQAQSFQQQQAAQAQNWQQQMGNASFQNQLRQQQVSEDLQQRGFTLNQINAILSGQQVNMPSFQGYNNATQGQAADLTGAATKGYQTAMDQANAAAAQRGQMYSAAGTAAMAFSDRRLKKDIRRIGRHAKGFGIYSYRFVGERGRPRVGVMAQEVRRFVPAAVVDSGGVLQVNYALLGMKGELA